MSPAVRICPNGCMAFSRPSADSPRPVSVMRTVIVALDASSPPRRSTLTCMVMRPAVVNLMALESMLVRACLKSFASPLRAHRAEICSSPSQANATADDESNLFCANLATATSMSRTRKKRLVTGNSPFRHRAMSRTSFMMAFTVSRAARAARHCSASGDVAFDSIS